MANISNGMIATGGSSPFSHSGVHVSSEWKRSGGMFALMNGTWRPLLAIYIVVGGEWRLAYAFIT